MQFYLYLRKSSCVSKKQHFLSHFSYIPQRYENQALTDQDYEAMLAQDEAKIIPGFGNDGIAVELEGEEKELGEKLMAKEAFNIVLSDKISLTRTVPDARHPM
jgi:hypothetical protein